SPQEQLHDRNRNRLLSAALNACWVVLNQLGVYEAAEEVLARAHHVSRDSASPHDIATQLMNRVKMLLGWGLRLERIGQHEEAAGLGTATGADRPARGGGGTFPHGGCDGGCHRGTVQRIAVPTQNGRRGGRAGGRARRGTGPCRTGRRTPRTPHPTP